MREFMASTALLPHQQAAVDKVLPVRVSGLFMDMGTGKTRTTIELARLRAAKIDHVIWLCPVSLKETVRREILKHTDCTAAEICVFDSKTNSANVPRNAMWYIVGVESLSSSTRVVLAASAVITERSFVVMDESSYIKGHLATRTKRATVLAEKARYRSILTGTPLSQGIVDLFSQMYFLSPKILGYRSFLSFEANHLEYHPQHPGLVVRSHNVPYLVEKIKPYVYQCTKDECLSIPHKIFKTVWCGLSDGQEAAYSEAKDRFFRDLEDLQNRYFDIKKNDLPESFFVRASLLMFRLFSQLQTIVCGFQNIRDESGAVVMHEYENERISLLLDIVAGIPEKDKIIIWAKYQHSIAEIAAALAEKYGVDAVAEFHGKLSSEQRDEKLNLFQNGARFLIATQSAGGHGLNLQFCHWQIFYANGFKYSERLQAEDRCHRHGQTRKVTYIDIFASNTIDEKIQNSLEKKGNLLASFRQEVNRIKDDKKITYKDKYEKLKDMVKGW